jgi:hypothetical protein
MLMREDKWDGFDAVMAVIAWHRCRETSLKCGYDRSLDALMLSLCQPG